MSDAEDKPAGVDERVERLICRCLDGEATGEERAALAGILARDPSVRVLHDAYRRIDEAAGVVLRQDLISAKTAAAGRRFRGLWLAAAGAVSAAAAVIALSFLPGLGRGASPMAGGDAGGGPDVGRLRQPSLEPAIVPQMAEHRGPPILDYRDMDHRPRRRWRDVRRDVIGIRDEETGVIYIFERNTHSTRLVPISGEI